MDHVTVLGLIAGTLTTTSFLPQVVKTWQSRSTKDISLGMFLTLFAGLSLWLLYGILSSDLPLIVTNSISVIFCMTILIFKWRFK